MFPILLSVPGQACANPAWRHSDGLMPKYCLKALAKLALEENPPGRGRGSSVGSIVCYLTGLSHVDPIRNDLFLGRFLSRDMVSVPDIDLDFPRDVRERRPPRPPVERVHRVHRPVDPLEHAGQGIVYKAHIGHRAMRHVAMLFAIVVADDPQEATELLLAWAKGTPDMLAFIENGDFISLEKLFSEYGPDYVGLCYDCGHGNMIADGLDQLDRFKERLISLISRSRLSEEALEPPRISWR